MAFKLNRTSCCGMKEIEDLGTKKTPEEALKAFCLNLTRDWQQQAQVNFSIVIFTGVVERVIPDQSSRRKDNYGQAFADHVSSLGLGDVVTHKMTRNPNTGNGIQCWIWSVDQKRLKSWADKVIAEQAEKQRQAEARKVQNDTRRTEAGSAGVSAQGGAATATPGGQPPQTQSTGEPGSIHQIERAARYDSFFGGIGSLWPSASRFPYAAHSYAGDYYTRVPAVSRTAQGNNFGGPDAVELLSDAIRNNAQGGSAQTNAEASAPEQPSGDSQSTREALDIPDNAGGRDGQGGTDTGR